MRASSSTASAATGVAQKKKKNDQSAVTRSFQGRLKIVSQKEVKPKAAMSSDSESDEEIKPRKPKERPAAGKMDVDEVKIVTTTSETPFLYVDRNGAEGYD